MLSDITGIFKSRRYRPFLYIPGLVVLVCGVLGAETAGQVAEHAQETSPGLKDFLFNLEFSLKYWVMLLLGAFVLFLILKRRLNPGLKISLLLLSTFLFGLAGNIPLKPFSFFAMHPSPICVTKAFLYGFGMAFGITLAVILLLTLAGPRLFCGFICPVGVIQELVFHLSRRLKLKQIRFSFRPAHAIRLLIFVAFIFVSASGLLHVVVDDESYALSIYDYANAFHGLEFSWPDTFLNGLVHYLPLLLVILLALKLYRPYCHFICPVGLFTHWLEQISLVRIRFHKSRCNSCGVCERVSPCTAIPEILKQATLTPDCYACQICVRKCAPQALFFDLPSRANALNFFS